MSNDISDVPIGFAEFAFVPYVLHQLRQFRDIVMKTRRYNNFITWNYRFFCFYILNISKLFWIYTYIIYLEDTGVKSSNIYINCQLDYSVLHFKVLKLQLRIYWQWAVNEKYVSSKVDEEKKYHKIDWFV